jgi:hypothetical protein
MKLACTVVIVMVMVLVALQSGEHSSFHVHSSTYTVGR